jgi:D-3-phosphoglycerate dehydrogenase / 2-oxoglutarate reductase
MGQKVLIPEAIHPRGLAFLLENGYEIKQGTGIKEDLVAREVEGCDAILTRNAVISERVMRASERLKVVAMHGVGVDLIDVQAATRLGIQVVNAKDSNKLAVAEFTIGLIIALSRNVLLYDKELRAGNWKIRQTLGMDLEGLTLGIIGMGAIGSLVAHKAVLGLGMKVIAHKRSFTGLTPMAGVVYTQDMDEVIQNADFLSLHVPSTPETKALIGQRELSLMKPGAFLINTARGDIVDNKALYEALRDLKIAGAALDVFPGEVIDRSDPLLALNNVILTPHAAAFTEQSVARMSLYAAAGIHEVLSGGIPTRPVNTVLQAVMA